MTPAGVRLARRLTLVGYVGLWIWIPLWYGWLAPPQHVPATVAIGVLLLPLIFPLHGILRGRAYTHAWSAFVSMIYFAHGVVETWALEQGRALAAVETVLAVVFFAGATAYARGAGRAATAPGPEG